MSLGSVLLETSLDLFAGSVEKTSGGVSLSFFKPIFKGLSLLFLLLGGVSCQSFGFLHPFLDILIAWPNHLERVLAIAVAIVWSSFGYWSPLFFAPAIAGNMSHLPTIVALDLSSVPLLADTS